VISQLIFVLFLIAALIQCGYALYFFARIISRAQTPNSQFPIPNSPKPVTIIICAKNEAQNLKRNLPLILAQRYTNEAGKPLYEVIVVNDASDDDTAAVLQQLEQQYDHLWDVVISPNEERMFKGKKFALSKGLQRASNEYILLTDADCAPSSPDWLSAMVAPLLHGKQISIGYGGYRKAPGLLNAFTRWETLHTFLQYSAYALAGKPYMAVGRNLACTKSILQRAQRSDIWNKLPTGDDDILVSTMATRDNTALVTDRNAFTYTDAKTSWLYWIEQKKRHLSAGKYYKPGVKALLGVYAMSHAILWLSFIGLLFTTFLKIVLVLMAARCLVYWAVWMISAALIKEESLWFTFPFFDFAWMLYNFAFSPYIIWKNKKQWT